VTEQDAEIFAPAEQAHRPLDPEFVRAPGDRVALGAITDQKPRAPAAIAARGASTSIRSSGRLIAEFESEQDRPVDPTGEDPRPAGNAVGVPTPATSLRSSIPSPFPALEQRREAPAS